MNHRLARIGQQLRAQLSSILAERVRDPRLVGVTILEVRPSADTSYARVFFRTFGDRDEAEAALEKALPFVRRCLAERSSRRRVPELDFRYDESQERAERVENILRQLGDLNEPEGQENAP